MPRKSNISQITSTADEGTPSKEKEGISVEDLSLPRTMVQRLAKGVLPPNTIIQKDAITAMSKAATVFVNYLSAHANTHTRLSSKKTITPADVLSALSEIEFEDFLPRLEKELARYSEVQTDKRNSYRKKAREEKSGGAGGIVGGGKAVGVGEGDGERARKRMRRGTEAEGEGEGVVDGKGVGEDGGEDTADEGEEGGEEEQEAEAEAEPDEEAEAEAEAEDEAYEEGDGDRGDGDEEPDAQLEQDIDDEALDNGEDSD